MDKTTIMWTRPHLYNAIHGTHEKATISFRNYRTFAINGRPHVSTSSDENLKNANSEIDSMRTAERCAFEQANTRFLARWPSDAWAWIGIAFTVTFTFSIEPHKTLLISW